MFNYKQFGNYIKSCRINSRLTLEQMAKDLHIDSKSYQAIEAGREHPSLETAVNIVNLLGITFINDSPDQYSLAERHLSSMIAQFSNEQLNLLDSIVDLILELRQEES